MTTKDKQKEEDFKNGFLEMAKALSELQDRAVEAYRPLVDDICNRIAKENEVEHLLTWMFDFVENEQMLLLYKKVCRAYFYTYPEVVGFYIMEYRKEYDRESLKVQNTNIFLRRIKNCMKIYKREL